VREKIRRPSSGVQRHSSAQQENFPSPHPSFGNPTSYFDPVLIEMLSPRMSFGLPTAAALFLYVGIFRSRYALFFYNVHWHPVMTHGGTNRRRTCIDILDDDSLLYIFNHCRPPVLSKEGIAPWSGKCESETWWYQLAWVCRRWRRIILASPSYLGISLVCRHGTSVADMLAHSPPLPLVIDHIHNVRSITAEDEEGILIAFKHRDRLRHIQLQAWDPLWEGLFAANDDSERLPRLEYLYIEPLLAPDSNWSLPSTLRAPRLRHLTLHYFAFPIGSPLLAHLVTLELYWIYPSANFGPNELLQQLSLMPHLETLRIRFQEPFSDQGVEGQLLQIPLSTHVTLPNLRSFLFDGPLVYMKLVLPRITAPLLKDAEITPFDLDFPIYFVLQFMCKTEKPRFRGVRVTTFDLSAAVTMYPHEGTGFPALCIEDSYRRRVDGLVSVLQRLREMGPVFSEVEFLTLEDEISLERDQESSIPSRTDWHELLGFFNTVRSLHVAGGDLIEGLSRSLLPEDQESAIGVLPDLRVLSCPKGSRVGKSCRSFIDVRRDAGHPVTLARR